MDACKKILKKETDSGRYTVRLQLFVQLPKGGTRSTGPHTVKLISSKEVSGQEFQTKKARQEIALLVDENGINKVYNFPVLTYVRDDKGQKVLDKKGENKMKLHYLVPKLADLAAGTVVIMTGKKRGMIGFVDVEVLPDSIQVEDSEIPIIEEDGATKEDFNEAFGDDPGEES